MPIIEVRNLAKTFSYYEKEAGLKSSAANLFRRKRLFKEAVANVSFSIEKGEIVGFLGPNGAGKTTTLKMLSGILYPTGGTANVAGYVPWERKNEYKRMFAFVTGQKSQLWPDLPAAESFRLNRYIYEVGEADFNARIGRLVDLFGVGGLLKVQTRRLSLGERMKMELIASLIHNPGILFLDEPTIGLDIISQQNIRELLRSYAAENGTTVILTSHYMRDIEELCPRVIIINKGERVYDGALNDVRQRGGGGRLIRLTFSREVERAELERFGAVTSFDSRKAVLEITGEARTAAAALMERLPVDDIGIEDIPIEKGIALLFSEGGASH